MIDIHSHILASVDDGADNLDVAVQMCRRAATDGCTAMLATPHQRTPSWWNCEPGELLTRLDTLQAAVGDTPRLYLGAEVRVDPSLLGALAESDRGGTLTLAGSSYLLLEFNRRGLNGLDAEGLSHELRLEGWRPIFAHPEFIPDLASDFDLMRRLADNGALFQLTAMSLTGGFGRRVRSLSERMLAAGLIQFIASDAHDLSGRPPGLSRAFQHLSRTYGEAFARRLTLDNPQAVINNRPIH
ncbi:MAG: tyrosine protein phosphatase [bacterium]|nr:tyrosine protein phosphatase [bacterium]